MKYLAFVILVAASMSPNGPSAVMAQSTCGSNGKSGPCPAPSPPTPRPAGPDTGGPGRQAPPSGNIPNGTPYGPGSGPHPKIGN